MSSFKSSLSPISDMNQINRRIMVFDLEIEGHHAGYIEHLASYWCKNNVSGYLDIVVSPLFLSEHPNVVNTVANINTGKVQFIPIATNELKQVKRQPTVFLQYFQQWRLFCKYAATLGADHGVLMYFDFFQLPVVLGPRPPCSFSAIYFRPTFHYKNFATYTPTLKERVKSFRKKVLLARVLRNPLLKTLFCLDPFATTHIENFFNTATKIIHLPDPVKIYNNSLARSQKLRESLEIDPDRKVLLLFGTLVKRKGIYQLLDAISLLSPAISKQLCLLIAGKADPAEEAVLKKHISNLRRTHPIQLIGITNFIVDQDIQPYFHLADAILAPYQHHMGMSAILVRAAAAQKPVLASDYGAMGEITQRYNLGLTLDSASPQAIAHGISLLVKKTPSQLFNRNTAKKFALENSAEYYAQTLLENL